MLLDRRQQAGWNGLALKVRYAACYSARAVKLTMIRAIRLRDMQIARFLLAGAITLLAAASSVALPALAKRPQRLSVQVLPWIDEPATQKLRDTADLPGTKLREGTRWWALACERVCSLQQLKLAVAKPVVVSLQDSGDTPGQHLRFEPAPPRGTLLLFRPVRPVFSKHPLKAGPVPSGYPIGKTPYVHAEDESVDASEVLVERIDGEPLLLSPTLLRPGKANAAEGANDAASWPISLDLRTGRRHQSLGLMGSCDDVPWRKYLLWAGDLDGDGRPDLVVQLDLAFGGEIALYLSSLAGRGEFVGEAGRSQLAFEGQC